MRGLNWFQACDAAKILGHKIRREAWRKWWTYGLAAWFIEGREGDAVIARRVVRAGDYSAEEFNATDWTDEDWEVTPPPIVCPPGYHYDPIAGACIADEIIIETICQAGYHFDGTACVPNTIKCPPGYQLVGNACVRIVTNPGGGTTGDGGGGGSGGGGSGGTGMITERGGGGNWGIIYPPPLPGDGGAGGKAPVRRPPRPPRPPGGGPVPANPPVPPGGGAPTLTLSLGDVIYGSGGLYNDEDTCWIEAPGEVLLNASVSIAGGSLQSGNLTIVCSGGGGSYGATATSGTSVTYLFDHMAYEAGATLTVTATYTEHGGAVYTQTATAAIQARCSGGGGSS